MSHSESSQFCYKPAKRLTCYSCGLVLRIIGTTSVVGILVGYTLWSEINWQEC